MCRKLLLFVLLLINLGFIAAQNVTFQTNVPSAVVKGEQFRLTYVLKNGRASSHQFPSEIKGLDVLYGPSVSQKTNVDIVNGKTYSGFTESYIFVLMANEVGTFTIPSASVQVNGKTYNSGAAKVRVLPPDQKTQRSQGASSQGASISSNDAFIRAIVTKTKVYEQEAFAISFRFYTTQGVRDIGKIEFPEFEGFMVEDVSLPANSQLTLEHYRGRNYLAVDLKKSLLFPQRSGKITIPSGKIEMVFSVPSGKRIDPIFGTTEEVMANVKRVMTTAPIVVDVTPLPEGKPSSFANAVGSFRINSKISDTNVKANDAITLTLTINGVGNLKLIKNPELKLPADFESYDPKVTNDLNYSENGLSGTKTIEYLFIPRHQGKFTIPALEFSYFDTHSKSYKTLKTAEYVLNVAKDPNAGSNVGVSYTNQNEVNVIKDILFLKTGDVKANKQADFLIGSFEYVLWYIIPIILFVLAFFIYRNQVSQNANIGLMKTKKANSIAIKRLKIAETHLGAHNKEKFYEEVLRSVWGYLSDKLTIPVAALNRENVENELTKYGVAPDLISDFISILDTCEFARYAPVESDDAMDKLYDKTVSAIGQMESVIKKKK